MALRGLILLDGVTGTGLGQTAGIMFESMAIGALGASAPGGSNQYYPFPYELFIACLGGTATVQIKTGNTIAGLTVENTLTMALNQSINRVGRLKYRYLALNVSVISGATLNAYLRFP
jgi:hypothetical protein